MKANPIPTEFILIKYIVANLHNILEKNNGFIHKWHDSLENRKVCCFFVLQLLRLYTP